MRKPESVEENRTHKIIWDIKMQTDKLTLVRRPDQVIKQKNKTKKNENLPYNKLCCPSWQQSEDQRKRKDW